MARSSPSGQVTFLFTDIEGSTRLWERDSAVMARALQRHNAILDEAIAAQGGVHFKTIGDAFQAAFPDVEAGVAAAVAAQRALAAEPWTETGPIRVRMALHLGEARPDAAGDYLAPCLNRLARLLATGFGGQVLLSQAVESRVRDALPAGVTLRPLGRHRLRDLLEPEEVAQLVISGLPDTFPPLKSLEGYPTNLPVLPTTLIGRDEELAELSRLLATGDRLVTIVGPGGVGKTHLALQAAADALERFADGVWVVPLGEVTEPELLLPRIAAALGVRESGGLDLREALFAYLGSRQALLVLDNAEHLLAAAPDIAELLARCPGPRVLATSRQRLGIGGERVVSLDPLPAPDWGAPPEALRENPAVRLFLERAAQHRALALDAEGVRLVASICARLDGLPLAIELAAAQISHYTPRELLAALEDRFGVLTGGRREALSHQQTLAATIAWSYDRLTADEQRDFRALSVFAGGWRRAAAAAVLETPHHVGALVESSLVRRLPADGDESRWAMLESIREFGRARLEAAGEAALVRERHAAWCLDFCAAAANRWHGGDEAASLEQLEREHDNARAALHWSAESGRTEVELGLTAALAPFWQVRGYLTEGRRWLEAALGQTTSDAPGGLRLQAMVDAGILAQTQGDNSAAAVWFEQALGDARAAGDHGRETALLNNLGAVALWRGELLEAERLFEEALSSAEAAGDRRRRADALANLGAVAHYRDDVPRALARYMAGVAEWRELGDDSGIADMLLNIVRLLAPFGEHRERARAAGEEALVRYRALRDPLGEAQALASLGLLALVEGDLERADEWHAASLALFREVEDAGGETQALGNLGLIALDRGDLPGAAARLQDALRLAMTLGEPDAVACWLEALATLRLAEGDDRRAARLLGAAEALRERIGIAQPPEMRARLDAGVSALRQRLGTDLEAVWRSGRALTLEEATSEALSSPAPGVVGEPVAAAVQLLDDLLGIAPRGG
jgi:predicted ATPase/class 3 adenylate cyclase